MVRPTPLHARWPSVHRPIPGMQNATVATGHAMLGLSLGPVTGKLVTDLIIQGKPELEVDLLKLAPERFG